MYREKAFLRALLLLVTSLLMGTCSAYAQQVLVTPIPGTATPQGTISLPQLPPSITSQFPEQRPNLPAETAPEKKDEQQAAQPKTPSSADQTSEFELFINGENAADAKNPDKKNFDLRNQDFRNQDLRNQDNRSHENKDQSSKGPDLRNHDIGDSNAGRQDIGETQTRRSEIRQFGYDLFSSPPSTFAPAGEVPVGPDYVVGPGDEIRVSLWGSIEGQWSSVVDRNGVINLPRIGSVGVTGLNYDQLKATLRKEVSKYYTGFEMNVSMGPLRNMRVYVVGNAYKPGAYTVSSLSTVVSALFSSGGPSKTGSMRTIRVERNGNVVARFDLYDLLLKGDKSRDIRLMPEDVVFIPPIGPLVAISGSVNTPAIYELKGEKKLSELIAMAGGLSTMAFKGRVQLERIVDGRGQVLIDADLSSLGDTDLPIQGGDIFKIFQVYQDRKVVRLMGAVNRPGEYGFNPGMRVKDLINISGGLRYYAYRKEMELTRVSVTPAGPKTEKVLIDLDRALAGTEGQNIQLREDDYLFVRTVPEWDLYRTVEVTGEVRFPGTFTIIKGERLSSLVERSGGYTDRAYLRGAIFMREQVRELQQKGIDEMVSRMQRDLLAESSSQLSTSLSHEEVEAKKVELEAKQKFIQALKDLKATGRMTIRLAHLRLLKNSEYDIELEDGDLLYIPTRSSVVNVMGSVMSMSSHIYREKFAYKDYISMSGGYTRYADKSSVYVLKVDGSARRLSHGLFSWSDSSARWEMDGFTGDDKEIEPGDTIIVPEKLDQIAWMREVKDITQILMQTAVTAGVVIELLNNN